MTIGQQEKKGDFGAAELNFFIAFLLTFVLPFSGGMMSFIGGGILGCFVSGCYLMKKQGEQDKMIEQNDE